MRSIHKYITISLISGSILLAPQLAQAEEGLFDDIVNVFTGSSNNNSQSSKEQPYSNYLNGSKEMGTFVFSNFYSLSEADIAKLESLRIPSNLKSEYQQAIEAQKASHYYHDSITYQNDIIDAVIELHNALTEYENKCRAVPPANYCRISNPGSYFASNAVVDFEKQDILCPTATSGSGTHCPMLCILVYHATADSYSPEKILAALRKKIQACNNDIAAFNKIDTIAHTEFIEFEKDALCDGSRIYRQIEGVHVGTNRSKLLDNPDSNEYIYNFAEGLGWKLSDVDLVCLTADSQTAKDVKDGHLPDPKTIKVKTKDGKILTPDEAAAIGIPIPGALAGKNRYVTVKELSDIRQQHQSSYLEAKAAYALDKRAIYVPAELQSDEGTQYDNLKPYDAYTAAVNAAKDCDNKAYTMLKSAARRGSNHARIMLADSFLPDDHPLKPEGALTFLQPGAEENELFKQYISLYTAAADNGSLTAAKKLSSLYKAGQYLAKSGKPLMAIP